MPLPPAVNTGVVPNDGLGDPFYVAFEKLNARDDYLLTQAGGWTGAVASEAFARSAGDADTLSSARVSINEQVYPTRAELLARDLPVFQLEVDTSGYSIAGVGGVRHKRRVGLPSHPGYFQTPDGSIFEIALRAGERVMPEMTGADPALADEHDQIHNAALVASALGAPIGLAPRRYRSRSRFDWNFPFELYGVPGKSMIDFSDSPTWQGGALDGLIRCQGSLGAPQALTQRAIFEAGFHFRVTSATRVGTTVTANTDLAHDFQVGDPIYMWGPSAAGQEPFKTENVAVGGSAMTAPFTIASVPTPTSYTYAVPNAGDTTLNTGLGITYARRAADVLVVPDTSGFTANQLVLIGSEAMRTDYVSENIRIGELNYVSDIISSTLLRLQTSVVDSYLTADSAKVFPVTPLSGVKIQGVTLKGKGPRQESGYGDRGIYPYLVDGLIIDNCDFVDVDQMGINATSCINFTVQNNRIVFNTSDESGRVSGDLDIQYGIAFAMACRAGSILNNRVFGGRHAAVQSATATAGYYGVCRDITISGNQFFGQWLEAISTHRSVDNLVIANNIIRGSRGGINCRYNNGVVIANNDVDVVETGIWLYGMLSGAQVHGNRVRAGLYPIRVDNPGTTAEFVGDLMINGNKSTGGENGIYVFWAVTGILARRIMVNDNQVSGTKYEGIRVTLGDVTASGDGWSGSVCGNQIDDCGQAGGRMGIWLSNAKGVAANDNSIRAVTTLSFGIYVDGAGTTACSVLGNRFSGTITTPVSFAAGAGSGHSTDAFVTETLTIASGVIALRFITTRLVNLIGEGGVADDLTTINGCAAGQSIVLRPNTSVAITVKDNAGNIQTIGSADQVLTSERYSALFTATGAELLQTAALAAA